VQPDAIFIFFSIPNKYGKDFFLSIFYSFSLLARGEKFYIVWIKFFSVVDERATETGFKHSTKWKTCRIAAIEFLMAGGVLFVVVY
jgi:hypothetical protein